MCVLCRGVDTHTYTHAHLHTYIYQHPTRPSSRNAGVSAKQVAVMAASFQKLQATQSTLQTQIDEMQVCCWGGGGVGWCGLLGDVGCWVMWVV